MRKFSKNRLSPRRRRSTSRRNFLRLERLENRLALAAVAANDFFHDLIDQPLDVAGPGILANDTGDAGQPLAAGLFSGPSHGTLSLNDNGSFHYMPEAGFEGIDSFLYFANDGASDSMLAAVTVSVGLINDAPTAVNDAFSLDEDGSLTVNGASGLLSNDSDPDGDTLIPTLASQPLHGTVSMNSDGSFNYTPEANYNGLDGFSYLVSDGVNNSDVASATITINPVNDLPVGVNDEFTTDEDTPLEIAAPGVLVNDTDVDGDALSSILVIPPQHGTVTLGSDGALLYTPEANFNGADGFSYKANDGSADSEATAVTVNVTPVNDAPASAADSYSTDEDTALVVDAATGVLANDTDAEGDAMTVAVVTGPANGTLTLNTDGSFNYTPNANFNGADSFTYTASDGTATGAETTVALTVNPTNDPPATAADDYSTTEDTTLSIAVAAGVLSNDSDPDGDSLTAAVVAGPTNGTLTLNADGSFDYTPNANFN
jgi:VCBS repeat-containing protein